MKILVTGAAGFIGFHLVQYILENTSHTVIGIDNINDYYDPQLKYGRLNELGITKDKIVEQQTITSTKYPSFQFIKSDIEDRSFIHPLFECEKFDYVIHLAAQAGVRYSLENPYTYIKSNIDGFICLLEACRHYSVKNLVYASSSSVYGLNKKIPFATTDNVDRPISLYAATKKSNELMAYTYSHLFNIPVTGLRFFTVYGPWGRPDMAYFSFTKNIIENKPIKVFNHGNMMRDFTYIHDIVSGVWGATLHPYTVPVHNNGGEVINCPYRLYNLGNNKPVKLIDFIGVLEKHVGKTAEKQYLPMQPGDVETTYADIELSQKEFGYHPETDIEEGLGRFVEWYKNYF